MAQEITYDQDEIAEIESLVESIEKLFDEDIKNDLTNDFTSISNLGFTNITKLQEQTNTLGSTETKLANALKKHDQSITNLENSIDVKLKTMIDESTTEDATNTSAAKVLDEITLANVNKGQKISTATLITSVHEFTYTNKKAIIKNILKYNNGSVTSLLTDPDKSNILVYEIKQMLHDNESEMSKTATEEEKEFQRELLDSIAMEKENVLNDVNEDTFLKGLPYYKKIADLNNLKVSELIMDKSNEELFTSCVKYVYDHTFVNGLLENDLASVKGFVKGVSDKNNIDPVTLLSGKMGASLIKGGM